MTAIMSGRLSLSDMGVAANLQGKMHALFSRTQAGFLTTASCGHERETQSYE